MAEAFLRQACGDTFEAYSAGLEPGKLNPVVVEAMKEAGIDISGNQTKAVIDMYRSGKPTKSVFDIFKSGKIFHYVITVCDETSAERCPIFPGVTKRIHWSFPDPSAFQGTHEEKLARTCEIRDEIKAKLEAWCEEVCQQAPS